MFRLKIEKLLFALFLASITVGISSCRSDDVAEENMYTFTGKTVGQYLEEDKNFSEFTEVLLRSKTMGLLKAYGSFTCFAPDNEAFKAFYQKKEKTSLDDFTDEEVQLIAYDHLINGQILFRSDLYAGRLPFMSMSDRYISVMYPESGGTYLNDNSEVFGLVDNRENQGPIHNGIIHLISEVLDPTRFGVVEAIGNDEKFSLFFEALAETRLSDLMMEDFDKTYDPMPHMGLIKIRDSWRFDDVPKIKKYGYTIFAESNETMNRNGIYDLESMKAYAAKVYDKMYPEDAGITDITNRKNSLNRFIAYHLVNKELSVNKLIDAYDNGNVVKTLDMFEYIEPMCPNTLIEIKKDRQAGQTNLINYISQTGRVICLGESVDNDANNGVYHEVSDMLVYDEHVMEEHAGKRLRFNIASFFPELTNNNFRGLRSTLPCPHTWFPRGYLEGIESSEQTSLCYVASANRLMDMQGDEIFMDVDQPGQLFDFTVTTPPVPKGTYEVRIGYLTNGQRGVTQFYFNDMPAGLPLNLNNRWTHVSIGGIAINPNSDDPFGYENDKMMRNQGFMKAPASIRVTEYNNTTAESARYDDRTLRKILGIYQLDGGKYRFGAKGLANGQFMIDYMEFIPVGLIETEDIY